MLPTDAPPFAAWDFETALIRPGLQSPPPVCLTLSFDGIAGEIFPTAEIREALTAIFESALATGIYIVGHNIAYDLACAIEWNAIDWDLVREAYARGLILDTMIFERLGEIGRYSTRKGLGLGVLVLAYGLPALGGKDKDDATSVRLSYGPLWNEPLTSYTVEQVNYAVEDAIATGAVFKRQCARYGGRVSLEDVAFQCRKAFWLHIARGNGLRTNPLKLDTLRAATEAEVERLRGLAIDLGFVREDGSKDMKAIRLAIFEAYEGNPPMTDASKKHPDGQVATSRSVLEESGDPALEMFSEYGENITLFNPNKPEKGVIAALDKGTVWPIHTKWGIADTTRTTSSKPNAQNPRRTWGVRECFEPRPGYVYVASDYGQIELCTLAQVLVSKLGRRGMADKINEGIDLHCDVAADIMKIEYKAALALHKAHDPIVFKPRQCGKVVNFGRPGGMGAKTLKFHAKQGYDVDITIEESTDLIDTWERVNPDGAVYLEWINSLRRDDSGRRSIVIPGTTITRRGCTFCSAANSHFQGFAATIAAEAGWLILCSIFSGVGPLASSKLVHFVHDEFILETPIGEEHEAAQELERLMLVAARKYLTDVAVRVESTAMRFWSKEAKALHGEDGRLIAWPPAALYDEPWTITAWAA